MPKRFGKKLKRLSPKKSPDLIPIIFVFLAIMVKTKIKLESDSPEEIFFFGISTTLKDYRFVHFLNKSLNISFSKKADLPYYITAEKFCFFLFYSYYDQQTDNAWFLIANKDAEGVALIKSLKNFDFFLLVEAGYSERALAVFEQQLRDVPKIQLVSLIKNKNQLFESLLEDLEMHLLEIRKQEKKKLSKWKRADYQPEDS